jgi:hypothetical protein
VEPAAGGDGIDGGEVSGVRAAAGASDSAAGCGAPAKGDAGDVGALSGEEVCEGDAIWADDASCCVAACVAAVFAAVSWSEVKGGEASVVAGGGALPWVRVA